MNISGQSSLFDFCFIYFQDELLILEGLLFRALCTTNDILHLLFQQILGSRYVGYKKACLISQDHLSHHPSHITNFESYVNQHLYLFRYIAFLEWDIITTNCYCYIFYKFLLFIYCIYIRTHEYISLSLSFF